MELIECTKKNLAACVGIPFECILELSPEDEMKLVSQKRGKPLVFSKERGRMSLGGGNPLLARKRIRTMQDIDRKIARIRF